ncbi:CheR family methyltransferase [Erythrobacter litoralis]|uniref:CheR family methyltransferase n=1 Tax=Erythrobacter litoralis TaxID=39960 RepID=UPI002435A863|nr:CheR family methyltransferase [Erythrobacter litoralis]
MTGVSKPFPIIGVGASAGGLEALRELFGGFDGQTGMAFVVVQHLDPTHESLMAQLIERYTAMSVRQASGGETIERDNVYVIPPGHGLALDNGVLNLTEFKESRGMRRPIDDFFESLAEDRGTQAACVILSGTGADGSRGLRAIKEHGGICLVQEPESAAYDGMPASAIGTGLVDIVSAPSDIVPYLTKFFERGDLSQDDLEDASDVADHIDNLCDVLRDAVGHDFSRYKRSTLNRRIARRMQVLGIENGVDYLDRLKGDRGECDALFRDLLINVTRFFRDDDQFEALNQVVIDRLVAKARDAEEIRVWVAGCSSGEEAYTIAILFDAAMKKHGKRPYVQVFATDIDDKMLEIARGATYPIAAITDIPEGYRDEAVIGSSERFTIAPHIRDMVRFSVHNVVRDPPFAKIDLISCRNVLIYFDDTLQKNVIPLFHFALKEDGKLFLGSSEAIGRYEDLFEVVDQANRLFRRKNVKGRYTLQLSGNVGMSQKPRRLSPPSPPPRGNDSTETAALKLIAQRYAPVSLLVDREGLLIDRWGAAGRYLDFPERLERNIHVPSLARPGLRELVSPLIRKASDTGRRIGAKDVEIRTDFGSLQARIVCEPLEHATFLIVIQETGSLELADDDLDIFEIDGEQQQFLEEELQATRHRLRSTVEELETTNEELKSSNEEMMSMNEELQSTNEELTTVNDELKSKVDQLTVANSDLRNFFDSTEMAVLVVDADLKLRSFTDAALELFPIGRDRIGDRLGDLPTRFEKKSYVDLARRAASRGEAGEHRVQSEALSAEYILRTTPYRLADGEIDGATIVFNDVTNALSLERDLKEERERLRLALDVAKIGIWEYEPSTDELVLDEKERSLLDLGVEDDADTMEPILSRLPGEDRDRINRALRMAMEGDRDFNEIFRLPLNDGQFRWLHGLGKLIETGNRKRFIGVTFDVTAEHSALDQRELMIREMNHRVKNLFSVISAMVTIAARNAEDVKSFAESLRSRIHALDQSHSLTTRTTGDDAGVVLLGDLIETVIAPNRSGQDVVVKGPDIQISDRQLTSLALILHEWATNSSKYGALSIEDGCLEVHWSEKDGAVAMKWSEEGGTDSSTHDTKPGFGTRLVETAARQLRGEATGEPTDDGYRRRLVFPLA